jgi:hypothetical protein
MFALGEVLVFIHIDQQLDYAHEQIIETRSPPFSVQ